MKLNFKRCKSFMLALCMLCSLNLITHAQSKYDQHEAFDPTFLNEPGTFYRSGSGAPGPGYWQNRADYKIAVTLNEKDTTIAGTSTITYTNNSPDQLDYLWLQLDQNLFDQQSRGNKATPPTGDRFGIRGFDGGLTIKSVSVTYKGATYDADHTITDTRMQVMLKQPLQAKGDQIVVAVEYSFAIPKYGSDRMGRVLTKNGWIYEIAQWYPRMEVYDDIQGWNTLPYLGLGEFYCDYGDYDYTVTAPADMTVVGSGILQNPDDVMTNDQIKRLADARKSDKSVYIIKPEEVGTNKAHVSSKGTLTWHFIMHNTRDVSFAASRAFVWDAAKVNVPSGDDKIAMSVYPVEVADTSAWGSSTEFLKASIEIYSKDWYEFPWKSAVNVAGVAGGMEYPGIIFCSWKAKGRGLWGVTTHEIGHNWFPMLVGSNERRFMWQDEGFNTFINYYATKQFDNGKYFRPEEVDTTAARLARHSESLMTQPAVINMRNYGWYYSKTSLGLTLLREDILTPERFDRAFREYINRWAFKHPRPEDFFRTMNDAAGENLNWFWKGWFYNTWEVDQAVDSVSYDQNDPKKGALVTISNLGQLPMPVKIEVTETNGKKSIVDLPVEVWQRGGDWTFRAPTTTKVTSVVIDPDHEMPDVDRSNNSWSAQ